MAKLTLEQIDERLERLAKQRLEEVEKLSKQIGSWVLERGTFKKFSDFKEHYEEMEMIYQIHLEDEKKRQSMNAVRSIDVSETNQNR